MSPELLIVSAIGARAVTHVCSNDGPIPAGEPQSPSVGRGPVEKRIAATNGRFGERRQVVPWSASAAGVIRQAKRVPPVPFPNGPPLRKCGIRLVSAPTFEPKSLISIPRPRR